jgi:5-methylcytosine-specific restriction endonuclease McrA
MKPTPSFTNLSDRELIAEVKRLANDERQTTAALIACLAEVDGRRLYLGEGCRSLFTYCTEVLHLSEHAAYGRIEAARAATRFPVILEVLASGALTLTAVTLLAPHLTEENHAAVLESAHHKSKREVEQIVAALHPRPDLPTVIRKLPSPSPPAAARPLVLDLTRYGEGTDGQTQARDRAGDAPAVPVFVPSASAVRPPTVAPLAAERFKVQFTVSRETHDKLRRAQDLLRHVVPSGDPAAVFDRALTILVAHLERQKLATTSRPRPARSTASKGRRIPAAVRRAVWRRDVGRCAFVGSEGRCTETGGLEFHHVIPFARGGVASVENIELRCRAHNQYEADQTFGSSEFLLRETPSQYGNRTSRTRSGPSCPVPPAVTVREKTGEQRQVTASAQ